MTDITALLTKEGLLRDRLDKCIENGKKTAIVKRTQGFYENKLEDLRKLWNEYSEIDFRIMELVQQSTTKASTKYVEEDRFGQAESKYTEYMGELRDGLRKFTTTAQNVYFDQSLLNQTMAVTQQESTLPKITIPKYNGDYDLWKSFHDLFVSLIHTNARLSPVQKLHHLKSCLIGDAERLLRHIPITNDDYEPAWNKLKSRYENKRIIVNHQLKILVNQPKIPLEKPKAIKTLLDTTDECLQQLKGLGVETKSWDVLLVYLLVQKLPYATLRLWEEEQGSDQELPQYEQFNKFLNKRLKILEAITDAVSTSSQSFKPQRDSTLAHHTTVQNKCPVCNGNHFVPKCKKYQTMDIKARRAAISKSGRCLNCLSRNHLVKDCSSNYSCGKCKQKHHTTLHEANDSPVNFMNTNSRETQDTDSLSNKASKNKIGQEDESYNGTHK